MSETTRREFLEVAGTAVAATVLASAAPAGAAPRAAPPLPVKSPLPVGPFTPPAGYQTEIYLAGMSAGIEPAFTTNSSALEALADDALPGAARKHLLAWAGGAAAVRANDAALEALRIVPRMFIDRAERDLGATVLGVSMPVPVLLGPVGGQALAYPDGEVASAQAAAALGLTYVHAAQASRPVEAVAVAAPTGSRWFGLDWPEGSGPDTALLTRAKLAGCTHLVLAPPQPGGSWAALTAVRAAWDGPIVLGGVQNAPDALEAVRRGLDAVLVSNERGRRGPSPTGTIAALPRIVDAVGGKVPVLFGSGVRTGTDVFRALALGVDAVVLTRSYVHGLALGGEPGVRHMVRALLAELDLTLAIAGVASYRALGPDALVRA